MLLTPKSSQTSLTRFQAESGADTRHRNLLLRRRFALARRHIDRTIALRLAYSAKGKSDFAKASRRAVGGSSQTEAQGFPPRTPPIGCFTAFCLFQRRNIVTDRERRSAFTVKILAPCANITIIQHATQNFNVT